MSEMPVSLEYLLAAWSAVTVVLAILVIYGNTLSNREDDLLFLNRAEQSMMASEQKALVGKMHRLARTIVGLAIVSAVLFLASAGLWVWTGLYGS